MKKLWEWLAKPDTVDAVVIGVVSAALFALLSFFVVRLWKRLGGALLEWRRRTSPPADLARYRGELELDTLRIHHSWMKEEQVLEDILIPVAIESDERTRSFETAFDRLFFARRHPTAASPPAGKHLAVIGDPGSGKSVALRVAAHRTWDTLGPDGLPRNIPVLITFAEFRRASFDMQQAIIASLARRRFDETAEDPSRHCEALLASIVPDGRLLVLVDGLDELRLEDRKEAIAQLVGWLRENRTVSAIVSCRTIPWREHRGRFARLKPVTMQMAPFLPAEMQRFIRRWRFDEHKSADDLIHVLESRSHLQRMGQNPLMLTILTFLYSLPKYRLPDNRAEFYEVCARALLEEWDQAQAHERANRFDRPHKEQLLARVAHWHLDSDDPEQDISQTEAHEKMGGWLTEIGLQAGENVQVLREIVQNSGILVSLPPDGLRFPHQTFLEYFGALYYDRYGNLASLGARYARDPRRHREVLLLYTGLRTSAEDIDALIAASLDAGDVELAVEQLVNCRATSPETARRTLTRAAQALETEPSAELIANLGYLARNRLSAFAVPAYLLLKEALQRDGATVQQEFLEPIILAVALAGKEDDLELIVANFERFRLDRVLPAMGMSALVLIARLVRAKRLAPEAMMQWIESLRLAGMPRLLYEVMQATEDAAVRRAAAVALAQVSDQPGFLASLDDPELPELAADPELEGMSRRWGWPPKLPSTERGKRIALSIGLEFARWIGEGGQSRFDEEKAGMHPCLNYLGHAVAHESAWPKLRCRHNSSNLQDQISRSATRFSRAIWRGQGQASREDWTIRMSMKENKVLEFVFFILGMVVSLVVVVWPLLSLAWVLVWEETMGLTTSTSAFALAGMALLSVVLLGVTHGSWSRLPKMGGWVLVLSVTLPYTMWVVDAVQRAQGRGRLRSVSAFAIAAMFLVWLLWSSNNVAYSTAVAVLLFLTAFGACLGAHPLLPNVNGAVLVKSLRASSSSAT